VLLELDRGPAGITSTSGTKARSSLSITALREQPGGRSHSAHETVRTAPTRGRPSVFATATRGLCKRSCGLAAPPGPKRANHARYGNHALTHTCRRSKSVQGPSRPVPRDAYDGALIRVPVSMGRFRNGLLVVTIGLVVVDADCDTGRRVGEPAHTVEGALPSFCARAVTFAQPFDPVPGGSAGQRSGRTGPRFSGFASRFERRCSHHQLGGQNNARRIGARHGPAADTHVRCSGIHGAVRCRPGSVRCIACSVNTMGTGRPSFMGWQFAPTSSSSRQCARTETIAWVRWVCRRTTPFAQKMRERVGSTLLW